MRVRWSQLVYRNPGSDNAVALAKVIQSPNGEVMRFQEQDDQIQEKELGYLALHSLSRGIEEELDEWIEVDESIFLEENRSLWTEAPNEERFRSLWTAFWSLFGRKAFVR